MTKTELILKLQKFKSDDVVILGDETGGWSNIETVEQDGSCIVIKREENPVFSDN